MTECEAERDALRRRVDRLKAANSNLRKQLVKEGKRRQVLEANIEELLTLNNPNRWN